MNAAAASPILLAIVDSLTGCETKARIQDGAWLVLQRIYFSSLLPSTPDLRNIGIVHCVCPALPQINSILYHHYNTIFIWC